MSTETTSPDNSIQEGLDKMYNLGIDHCIDSIKLIYGNSPDNEIHSAFVLKVISQLEKLKSKK
jgi:hypothetical protein